MKKLLLIVGIVMATSALYAFPAAKNSVKFFKVMMDCSNTSQYYVVVQCHNSWDKMVIGPNKKENGEYSAKPQTYIAANGFQHVLCLVGVGDEWTHGFLNEPTYYLLDTEVNDSFHTANTCIKSVIPCGMNQPRLKIDGTKYLPPDGLTITATILPRVSFR